MAKKKANKHEGDAPLPKFGGFHPLAGGLQGFKAKLDAEKKTEEKKGNPPPRRPPAARPQAPKPGASAADDDLSFHRMMSGVTPLESSGKSRIPRTAELAPQRPKAEEVKARAAEEASKALDHLHALVDEVARFEVSDDGKRVEGRRVDAAPDLVRNLRHGRLPIDGRLDLHGMTASQAQEALAEFLRTMRTRNERCVLVIHGKGERHAGAGILRGEIAAWLAQGKGREHVAAFVTAREEDGGEGAVYVALRR